MGTAIKLFGVIAIVGGALYLLMTYLQGQDAGVGPAAFVPPSIHLHLGGWH